VETYPEGKILSRDTGHKRAYGMNPYIGYDDIDQTPFLFDGPDDDRLSPNEKVIAIKEKGMLKAYPYSLSKELGVINDVVGGKNVVVFHGNGAVSALDSRIINESKEIGSTGVFDPMIENKLLTFEYVDGKFKDKETGSTWGITGKAIGGKFKGNQLKRIKHGDYFAFAWLVFMPQTEIFELE
jgi:hypothetical protein